MPPIPDISLPDFYSILSESYGILSELGLFVFGMIVYSVFIFQFYRFLARKDIFVLDLEQHNHARLRLIRKGISLVMYIFKFLILFPIFAFVWFVVLAILLSFMAKDKSIENIFLVSMGVLGAIRIAAYYNEALSTDLAKILPFAMLGIFLIDRSFLSHIGEAVGGIQVATTRWDLMAYYLVIIVLLEFVLRISFRIIRTASSVFTKTKANRTQPPDSAPLTAPSPQETG